MTELLLFFSGVVEYTLRVLSVPWGCPEYERASRVLGLLYSCFEGVVRALGDVYVFGLSYFISGWTLLLGDMEVFSSILTLPVPTGRSERADSTGLL